MSNSCLINNAKGHIPASQRIPPIVKHLVSEKAKKTIDLVESFVEQECIPADAVFEASLGQTTKERFSAHPAILEDLKRKARSLGLWNLFLPKNHFRGLGADFTNLEYALMAELLGKSMVASEACNCSAPDTGNMELLARYGSEEQKKAWLEPLLDGRIRSAFLMTEPGVAGSDATNIGQALTMERARDGGWILNGESVLVVPADTPGITVKRVLSVIGFDHAPEGHAHISFKNVHVPKSALVLGEGRGFEIVQGRLGPGRIHHAMRSIGAAEKALEWALARVSDPHRTTFGKTLGEHGMTIERIAQSRIEIDGARLAVLNAAHKIDEGDAKHAFKQIAQVKVVVPRVMTEVVDRAIQVHGGAGVSQDTPLASLAALARMMRIVDGPDEVHLFQLGRNEIKNGRALYGRIEAQKAKTKGLFKEYGVEHVDPLALNRTSGGSKL
ncbi:hypothetical protein H2200_006336 [Cladophialophora chaetospira]|uniref:Acyl-CoA dehydrogenase n=1 Tax=Cladophialophora chaetospira TaxID=386627 RepID=A0AA39CIZ3_9EURO|nr:hypothetical protein H2200_006336 [Cladophialophora chaetospira]